MEMEIEERTDKERKHKKGEERPLKRLAGCLKGDQFILIHKRGDDFNIGDEKRQNKKKISLSRPLTEIIKDNLI